MLKCFLELRGTEFGGLVVGKLSVYDRPFKYSIAWSDRQRFTISLISLIKYTNQPFYISKSLNVRSLLLLFSCFENICVKWTPLKQLRNCSYSFLTWKLKTSPDVRECERKWKKRSWGEFAKVIEPLYDLLTSCLLNHSNAFHLQQIK